MYLSNVTGQKTNLTADDIAEAIYDQCRQIVNNRKFYSYIDLDNSGITEAAREIVATYDLDDLYAMSSISDPEQTIECGKAVFELAVSVVLLCITPLGLSATEKRIIVNKLVPKGGTLARGLIESVKSIASAKSNLAAATAIATLFMEFMAAVPVAEIIEAIGKEVNIFRIFVIGATAGAQLTAWIASGGAALIAEIVLMVAALAGIIEGALDVGKACHI